MFDQGAVSRICLTADDAMIFSASEDGTFWIFEQVPPNRRGQQMPV